MKPGIKSTEFYTTLVPGIVSLLLLTGVISPDFKGEITELVQTIVAGIVAMAAFVSYLIKRTELKKAELYAGIEGSIVEAEEEPVEEVAG